MNKKMVLTEFSGEEDILKALNTGNVVLENIEYLEEKGQAPCISIDLKDAHGIKHALMFNGDGIWFYGKEQNLMVTSLQSLLAVYSKDNKFKYWIDNGVLYGGDKECSGVVTDVDIILSYTVDNEDICIETKGNYKTAIITIKLTPDGPEM